jgi:hypothetical protein
MSDNFKGKEMLDIKIKEYIFNAICLLTTVLIRGESIKNITKLDDLKSEYEKVKSFVTKD